MSVTIDFVGMVYFVHEDDGSRRVFFPDGTVVVDNVPQHFASIFADKSAVRTSDWWDTPQKDVFLDHGVVEFSIPKAKAAVTISGVSTELRGAALDTSRHEPQIPKLRSINQNFVLDTKSLKPSPRCGSARAR